MRAERRDLVIDTRFNLPGHRRGWFHKATEDDRRHPYKLLDLHLQDDTIRDISAGTPMIRAIGDLLGARPLVCNSLLFEWGSQQEAHFDTFFMPSKTPGMMAASWVAIDPVTSENGPLYYYPRSHRIAPYRFSDGGIAAITAELKTGASAHIDRIVAEHGLKKTPFLPQQGDLLIWHAQLLHGGASIENRAAPRRSLVTHYWTERDFPDPEQRIDLGSGRWLLRRPPMFVIDDDIFAEIDTFLDTVSVPNDIRAAMPENFDPRLYLARNQDVLKAGVDPWTHYHAHGQAEGRRW